MSEPFDLEDMRYYADRHRGKHVLSGPHWSLVLRFPILFDQYEKTLARAEAAERELAELQERTRWIPFTDMPRDGIGWVVCLQWITPRKYWQRVLRHFSNGDFIAENFSYYYPVGNIPLPVPPEAEND